MQEIIIAPIWLKEAPIAPHLVNKKYEINIVTKHSKIELIKNILLFPNANKLELYGKFEIKNI